MASCEANHYKFAVFSKYAKFHEAFSSNLPNLIMSILLMRLLPICSYSKALIHILSF
jgi:hypothetical protein